MIKTPEDSKFLASLAVFRELYNNDKDVIGIISDFLIEIIQTNAKYSFNIIEITNLLNETYDFNIPEAVIRTALKRLPIKKQDGLYSVSDLSSIKSLGIDDKKEEIQNNNNQIIESLFQFVSTHEQKELNENEMSKVVNSFISFILDGPNHDSDYSNYVSAFIIENVNNSSFKTQLSTIKEGVILYSGLKYNNDLNDIGSWRTDLTIFLETEILFHFAGFNGEVYQKLWDDFFSFVREINGKQKNKIKIKYFREVKEEVERFFRKAEHIVDGKEIANPKVTAMMSIINGCSTKADVVSKKAKFYRDLSTVGISEDDYHDYYSEQNYIFNITNNESIERISKKLNIYEPIPHINFLNFISILRKNLNANNFENIGFILLSGNSKTLKIAWDEEIKEEGQVPLATTLSFLTNKFWFKLNKGFGHSKLPSTFDVITKAQIVLSNQVNESVGKKFEELQASFKAGKTNKDDIKAAIIELRKQAKKPEDIVEDNIESVLSDISEDSIEVILKEQELFRAKAELHSKENSELKVKQELFRAKAELHSKENSELKVNLLQKEQEVSHHLQNTDRLSLDLIDTKKALLKEKEKSIINLEDQKASIVKKVKNLVSLYKILIVLVIVLLFFGSIIAIFSFGWEQSEPWTFVIFGLFPIVVIFIYFVITEKSLRSYNMMNSIRLRVKRKQFKNFDKFEKTKLEMLCKERAELESEINKINDPTQIY